MRHFLCTALIALATGAAAEGDADNGALLAEENCARCHDISPGGAAKQYPPSFASIAGFRPEEQIVARILFPDLHSPMPAWNSWLTRSEIDDLTAFILSLEGS